MEYFICTAGARATVIEEFNKTSDCSPSIMLLSLTAGGVGLNLTAASRVFLLDPVIIFVNSLLLSLISDQFALNKFLTVCGNFDTFFDCNEMLCDKVNTFKRADSVDNANFIL